MGVYGHGRARPALAAAALAVVAIGGCTAAEPQAGPVVVAPGAPGEPGRILTEAPVPGPGAPHSAADVQFVRAMIDHHAQALRMTRLVPQRTQREDIALFATRVEISQQGEIAQMEDWLEARGEPTGSHDHHGPARMPGMLTEEQYAQLESAAGAEFDRRFLELMIYHHEGALIMVDELRAAGGAQEAELFALLSHIDTDQRIEIGRMQRLLASVVG